MSFCAVRRNRALSHVYDFSAAAGAIGSAAALTETTFLKAGQRLESSIEILAALTTGFEAVLAELNGDHLAHALEALSRVAAQVNELGRGRSKQSAIFDRLLCVAGSIGARIVQMTASLKDVDALAINSKIAAANIHAPGMDFSTFADEIGRTLTATRTNLHTFGLELETVRRCVAMGHARQLSFEKARDETADSVTQRLSATVQSISRQHHRAARASAAVRQGTERVQQRIGKAILALQIGDVTRQRLEHADYALGLLTEERLPAPGSGPEGPAGLAALDPEEQDLFALATERLQSAQLQDAARRFEREVRKVTESLESLAVEARALRDLGDSAFRSSEGGGNFIRELGGQVDETLRLLEGFETARAEAARVTATVTDATATLGGQLRKVRSLEADVRVMGLNTTFKCARVGREGLALSLIAQELRTYANGFAKEADALIGEVQAIARTAEALTSREENAAATFDADGTQAMKDSLVTLGRAGEVLDDAPALLERDTARVIALLEETVASLGTHNEIGPMLREAAGKMAAMSRRGGLDKLPPRVEQILDAVAGTYTMAIERIVHDRVLGRSPAVAPVASPAAAPELEDFLF